MSKIEEKKWDNSILDNATLIHEGYNLTDTYDLGNGNILKKVKSLDEIFDMQCFELYYPFLEHLESKMEYASEIDNPDLVLPNCIYRYGSTIKAYSVPKVNGIDLNMTLPKIKNLKLYGEIFRKLIERVKILNGEGIIFPDLATLSNIFYDYQNDRFRFIDYDGIQVHNSKSISCSNLLMFDIPPLENGEKYGNFKNGWTKNLDILSLMLLYFVYVNRINITDYLGDLAQDNGRFSPTKVEFESLFNFLGIDDLGIQELITRLYDEDKDNIYPDEVFQEFSNTHRLVKKAGGT